MLEAKQSSGHCLDDQQIAKLQTKFTVQSSLAELGAPVATQQGNTLASVSQDGKGNKKAQLSKKQRRKNKQGSAKVEMASGSSGFAQESESAKEFVVSEISQASKHKVGSV